MTLPEGSNECIAYNLCSVECNQDTDCDDGGSGNATLRCNPKAPNSFPTENTGACELICDSDTVCPDGIACVNPQSPSPRTTGAR